MLKQGRGIAIEKRGGQRRVRKRRPKKIQRASRLDYYKDNKLRGILPKKLCQYRFLICTDLEPDDMVFLTMFTAWVKTNEHFFDSRSQFPIYGFLVGETRSKRIKAQRAREFLKVFADILGWDDTDHHLYKGYNTAGQRVWFDGSSDTTFDSEKNLIDAKVLDDPDYPDPELFIDTIDELLKVKANNLFAVYLKPVRLFQTFKDRPDVCKYLQQVPGAIYGSWNVRTILTEDPELTEPILNFLNRKENDAPLLYAESFFALGEDNTINVETCPKLFRELDDSADGELAKIIKDTMYAWNDNISNRIIEQLTREPEFAECDFDDYKSFSLVCEKLTEDRAANLANKIKILDVILRCHSQQFVFGDPLVMIAMLIANNTLADSPFRLEPSKINYTGRYMETSACSSNTHVLLPKTTTNEKHSIQSKKLLSNMLCTAFALTTEN